LAGPGLGANFAGFRGDPRPDLVDAPGQREVEVDMGRGQWIDPRGADVALEQWVEALLTFAQSLSPAPTRGRST
jgi:hypothetical protein